MKPAETIENDLSGIIGLDALSDSERGEMLKHLGELIMEGVLVRVLADMGEEDADKLEKTLESETDIEVIASYLEKNVPDFSEIFDEEVAAFREETIAVMDRSKEKEKKG